VYVFFSIRPEIDQINPQKEEEEEDKKKNEFKQILNMIIER